MWKTNVTKVITEAITMQLDARLVDLGTDDIQEERDPMDIAPSAPAASDPIWDVGAEQRDHEMGSTPDKKKGRKDPYGIGNAIDRFATNAITANKAATMAKKHKDLLEEAGLQLNINETS